MDLNLSNEEFCALAPEKIKEMMDRNHEEEFGHSLNVREDELQENNSSKKDFSMGAYFHTRSSYPFPSLNGNITLMDPLSEVPERDHSNVSRRSVPRKYSDDQEDSLFASMEEPVQRASPKFCHDSMFAPIAEVPQPSPGIAQDSLLCAPERELPSRVSFRRGQDSLFTPLREQNSNSPRSTSSSQTPFDRRSVVVDADAANVSDSSIKSLQEFFADPDSSPMSSSDMMDYVLQYCRIRNEKGTGRGIVKDLNKQRREENLSVLSRRLSQELGEHRKINYTDFSSSLHKKINSSRCSTPDMMSVKSSTSSGSGSSRKSLPSMKSEGSSAATQKITSELVRAPRPSESKMVREKKENMENKVPASNLPSQQVQIQFNLPQSGVPSVPNFHAPLIINIVCPVGYSQGSAVQRIDPQSNATDAVSVRSESQEPQPRSPSSSSSNPSHIAIQFSGCIQWK